CLAIRAALHGGKHIARSVLQGHIEIPHEPWMFRNRVEQLLRHAIWIRIEKTDPSKLPDLREPREKMRKSITQAEIFSVACCVLPDECDFANARAGQLLGFTRDRFKPAAAKFSAQLRNDAEGAGMIAAFRDFDVGRVARSGHKPRCKVVIEVVGSIRM